MIRREITAPSIAATIVASKDAYGLGNLPDVTIRAETRLYFEAHARLSPNEETVIASVVSTIRATLRTDDGTFRPVPVNTITTYPVGATTYSFYNDHNGYLDFLAGVAGHPPAPHPGGTWDLNIEDPMNPGYLLHTGKALASSRADHFKSANIIREGMNPPANGSSSPAGWTWHHHFDQGRLQLIDRDVHQSFAHRGGFSRWGG